jgi:hypothetical protein
MLMQNCFYLVLGNVFIIISIGGRLILDSVFAKQQG